MRILFRSFFMILICTVSTISYSMEIESSCNAIKVETIPDDICMYIFKLSYPSINLHDDKKAASKEEAEDNAKTAKKHVQAIAVTIMNLRRVCAYFNHIVTKNSAFLLGLNKENIDIFLVRSTQANIPYFMKIAFENNAHPDAINTSDSYTPLLYAVFERYYSACTFLLENGADVNIKQLPIVGDYLYYRRYVADDFHLCPIHIAVKNGDTKLVTLCIEKGVHLNIRISGHPHNSLLTAAADNNDSDMLALLLNACPYDDYIKNWSYAGVRHALVVLYANEPSNAEKENHTKCIQLLEHAEKATQNLTAQFIEMARQISKGNPDIELLSEFKKKFT
jgi:hypothetical protein